MVVFLFNRATPNHHKSSYSRHQYIDHFLIQIFVLPSHGFFFKGYPPTGFTEFRTKVVVSLLETLSAEMARCIRWPPRWQLKATRTLQKVLATIPEEPWQQFLCIFYRNLA